MGLSKVIHILNSRHIMLHPDRFSYCLYGYPPQFGIFFYCYFLFHNSNVGFYLVTCKKYFRFVFMTHGSLFSGIGGFDLAAEWMGWTNKFHCEINPFCKRVLNYYWPDAKSYDDIKTTDFTVWRGLIDVLTGGDPCQGNSVIGKQEGESYSGYLWPENLRAIREILPRFAVNENVPGSISNGVLDRKISDLESIGYSCWPPILVPASYFGANHKRGRVFIIANSTERRLEGRNGSEKKGQWKTEIRPIKALVDYKNGSIHPKPEFLRGNDGIPRKLVEESIKGYGNAVVPQVAYEIFKAIEQATTSLSSV